VEVRYEHCAGLDVHKKTVVACVLHSDGAGKTRKQVRSFSTMLPELEQLRDWFVEEGCTHAVMEATGVYWKPVYNVLESQITLLVVNPEHVKVLSGRKTDVKDAEWLADLLRHGLLRGSFIPERDQRDLRELTRFRSSLIQDRARAVNRLQKTLEGANIKLSAVLSDVLGASGQRMLEALLSGEEDPEVLASLGDARLRGKHEALKQALMGKLRSRLHFVVSQELAQIRHLDEQIETCDAEVAREMRPFDDAIERLDEIPGIGRRSAENILSETGLDLSRWHTVGQFAAWCGVCPGNRASGGKRRPARVRKGNPWIKRASTEAAWACLRTKQSYLGERGRRLSARKGHKRAIVALAHEIMNIIYYMLTRSTRYQDLGLSYLEERDREAITRQALHQLQRLGFEVALTLQPTAA
jgi:transposase